MLLLYWAIQSLVLAVCILPLGTLAARLVQSPGILWGVFKPDVVQALLETFYVCLASLAVSLVIALPTAWWLVRTNLPARALFRRAFTFAYIIPPYLFAVAWVMIGVFSGTTFYHRTGLIWVFTSAYLPILITSLCSAMERLDPALEEAGRVFGASPQHLFFKISLPCLLPSIASASLLYLLAVTSAFGVPAIIGNPGRVFLLTTKVVTATQMGGVPGMDLAIGLSLWLFSFSALLLAANALIGRKFQMNLVGGKVSRPSLVDLGNFRLILAGVVGFVLCLVVLLPMLSLALSSLQRVAGDLSLANFTFENYAYLWSMQDTQRAIQNSLLLALGTGVFCTSLGFFVAFFQKRTRFRGKNWLVQFASLPFALPGTLLALGFILSYGTGWGIEGVGLLGSLWLLFLAYAAKDLALGVQSFSPALAQIDPALDEAARVFGATRLQVLSKILLPLLTPTAISVLILSALPALSELTMSVLLSGPGTETLGTLLFQLLEYANRQAACSLACVLILFLSVLLWLSRKLSERVGTPA